jgi:hypothetical protein
MLWNKGLKSRSPQEALGHIAEFEWWFFAANPLGRCGASLGTCLSLALQMATGNTIPSRFRHLDWQSLSRDLPDYRRWRIRNPR